MNLQTYLFFDGDCQQAIELYGTAFQAEVLHVTLFSDAPAPLRALGQDDLVFHSTIQIGETLLNLSDDPSRERGRFGGFALLVHLDSAKAVDLAMEVLASEGQLELSAQKTFWADRYGIVTDRFGITWKLQFSE